MCKTGRKINKINFNKFIWLYWKMKKIYILYNFFCGFPVVGTMKKQIMKKKGAVEQEWATAHFF